MLSGTPTREGMIVTSGTPMDLMVRTFSGGVAVGGVLLRLSLLGSLRENGMIIGLILVLVIKNVDIILRLFGGRREELGVPKLIVLVVREFS